MDGEKELEILIGEAANTMLSANYVVALTGAGVSVESGIPPFRGPGGIWTERGEPSMDGYKRFQRDPKGYWERRMNPERSKKGLGRALLEAEPNPGHIALSDMERIGVVRSVITQNIDDLHNAAGSSKVLEIHGNVRKFRCTACESRYPVEGFDVSEIPPRCPACGGIVKSDTVMFGEPIPTSTLNKCIEEANLCDCMLIVGTSATVYPAAALPIRVKRRGGALIEINPFTSELTDLCDISIRAPSGEILPLLLSELNKRLND